jgi:hypothetical protein
MMSFDELYEIHAFLSRIASSVDVIEIKMDATKLQVITEREIRLITLNPNTGKYEIPYGQTKHKGIQKSR